MDDSNPTPQWVTINVAAGEFQRRMSNASGENGTGNSSANASVYSRLALLHRVAKAYALDAVKRAEMPDPIIEIDEITDPPLYEGGTDEPVIIRFSYTVDS